MNFVVVLIDFLIVEDVQYVMEYNLLNLVVHLINLHIIFLDHQLILI